ncbi:hypothetical protein [Catellatospora methionotrophica]|uniref:hypothetical protein n=1 Tax=Catellatospora methionotrophica TaxID=121620 RepID=UPI00340D22CF
MTSLLQELSKRVLDRWAAVVFGPGLLFVACAWLGLRLGHRHAADVERAQTVIARFGVGSGADEAIRVGLALAAVAFAAALCGWGVASLGRAVEAAWGDPPGLLADRAAARRRRRWLAADRALTAELDVFAAAVARGRLRTAPPRQRATSDVPEDPGDARARRRRLRARRDRVAPAEPVAATWIADRIALVERRVLARYGFALRSAWPHLWSVAPEPLRTDLTSAQRGYADAARLFAWGLAYLVLGLFWWPALLIGLVVLGSGRRRARRATEVLAQLLEATVDLHGRELAMALGIACDGPLTTVIGQQIEQVLAKTLPEQPAAVSTGP